jgi:lipopolysaccharide export LptBFGC system permease protein LptF
MKKKDDLLFWNKSSNVGALFCFLILVVFIFLKSEVKTYFLPFFIGGIVAVLFFLTAELMKFIIKRRKK